MYGMDLSRDEYRARIDLEPRLRRVRGLLQIWTNFHSAEIVAREFAANVDKMNMPLLLACTKAVVVDYYRPWSRNFNGDLKSLRIGGKNNWRYPFLDSVTNTPEHKYLEELRNQMIAHADSGFEAIGVTAKGVTVPNTPQHARTIASVFLPIQLTLGNVRGIWWIKNRETAKEILAHIEIAKTTAQVELNRVATKFRDACINHMHVLDKIDDVLLTSEIQPDSSEDAKTLSFKLQPFGESGNTPVVSSAPTKTQIGDENLQPLAVVYEPEPRFPNESNIIGRGWQLQFATKPNGAADFNVIFPSYPFPQLSHLMERAIHYCNMLRDDPNSAASPETNLRGLLLNQVYLDESETNRFLIEMQALTKPAGDRNIRDLIFKYLHGE